MEENDMSQADLARLLGSSSGNVSEIMSGKRELSKPQISIVAERFKISPSAFLPKGVQVNLIAPTGRKVKSKKRRDRTTYTRIDGTGSTRRPTAAAKTIAANALAAKSGGSRILAEPKAGKYTTTEKGGQSNATGKPAGKKKRA
jgi:transcriptional regulator with XRE-family HTH domain